MNNLKPIDKFLNEGQLDNILLHDGQRKVTMKLIDEYIVIYDDIDTYKIKLLYVEGIIRALEKIYNKTSKKMNFYFQMHDEDHRRPMEGEFKSYGVTCYIRFDNYFGYDMTFSDIPKLIKMCEELV